MNIHEYLCACRELSQFCSQNGWIDNETLEVEIVKKEHGSVIAMVSFEEIIVEAAGCIGGKIPCQGRVRVFLDGDGNATGMEIL
uniref:Uncharacterized protein n=1 Tax=Candidatus Kentrum sp. MB TaxID=2138164 RepID=A0A450X8D3_9GAMM|nr:MAG: hypothetical protein BECKMB1821G_GA0114241_101440 [Candidatus Kentron sp. MB]VFK34475.1 MAG: hypothetical protein BECKMB1821I_GA0114274_10734 [Candidatus Kentron sp. MB]VFK76773.1 MAG: hypothetical protein BECKMB1821H_GA0114242_10744 [Candidatus Kentron sp. MB]